MEASELEDVDEQDLDSPKVLYLRVSGILHRKVKQIAAKSNVSANKFITTMLEQITENFVE